ncbi:MAG: hypothetical protein ABIR59_08635 [Gemmatimonadales bacterium]
MTSQNVSRTSAPHCDNPLDRNVDELDVMAPPLQDVEMRAPPATRAGTTLIDRRAAPVARYGMKEELRTRS